MTTTPTTTARADRPHTSDHRTVARRWLRLGSSLAYAAATMVCALALLGFLIVAATVLLGVALDDRTWPAIVDSAATGMGMVFAALAAAVSLALTGELFAVLHNLLARNRPAPHPRALAVATAAMAGSAGNGRNVS